MSGSPSVRYAQAREDHEYLWREYGAADDKTGAYVDQEDLARLLKSPTKATAAVIYEAQITYWFETGPSPEERIERHGLDALEMRDDPAARRNRRSAPVRLAGTLARVTRVDAILLWRTP